MKIIEEHVTRRDVITYYVKYDRKKKNMPAIENLESWSWNDPKAIDEQLKNNNLKSGVLSAYREWQLTRLDYADIAGCAIVNHIFRGQPQALGRISQSLIANFKPLNNPDWWEKLSSGSDITRESALILRPSVSSERPATWYIEDGSGRALALFQRMLLYSEFSRTAYAYIGIIPDEGSHFIIEHPELLRR